MILIKKIVNDDVKIAGILTIGKWSLLFLIIFFNYYINRIYNIENIPTIVLEKIYFNGIKSTEKEIIRLAILESILISLSNTNQSNDILLQKINQVFFFDKKLLTILLDFFKIIKFIRKSYQNFKI